MPRHIRLNPRPNAAPHIISARIGDEASQMDSLVHLCDAARAVLLAGQQGGVRRQSYVASRARSAILRSQLMAESRDVPAQSRLRNCTAGAADAATLNAENACETSTGEGCGLPAVASPRLLQVYSVIDPEWGKAFHRIDQAFRRFSPPWVKWVDRLEDADVHIMHFLGAPPARSTLWAHVVDR
jgi:hypothetical protein